ncbi:CopG family transcriptional regulator [Subtercola boreus]|uniref:CopG family transcriptional regulator n=1 Tax=Subtercola boreus TaxID=120213 RepID=A0A3E0VSC0_9MICO|nr:CopG family transcriptional regulator [Subtercola boreus]RFA07182.1 CopG family transcriptional regulator [Subtercola boreus]RFA12470.1 CopG family transcriptional regulator [Subtercola boreus]
MADNSINGEPVSDAQLQKWADEAEIGYDTTDLKRRGRPRMGSSVAHVTTIRLDPELESALEQRAAAEHVSRSEVIRHALREWLKSA